VLIGKTGSEIKRPVNKLFPIEYATRVNSNDEQEEVDNIEAEESAPSEVDIPNDATNDIKISNENTRTLVAKYKTRLFAEAGV